MIYCVSDIHGEYGLLCRLLDKLSLREEDTLLVLGDMIDKGAESVKVLKLLFSMKNARCIMGNHEFELYKTYRAYMHNGLGVFDFVLDKMREYLGGDPEGLLDWDILDTLGTLPYYLEYEDFICVHAGIPLDEGGYPLPLCEAEREALVYDRRFKSADTKYNGKCVIFGHTPTSSVNGQGKIIAYPRVRDPKSIKDLKKVQIDTGASLDGRLGAFRVDDLRAFYVEKQ